MAKRILSMTVVLTLLLSLLAMPGVFAAKIETRNLVEEDYEDGVILTLKFTVNSSALAGSYDIEISYEPNAIKGSNYESLNNIVVENGAIIVE